jgi:glyoxylase-like metal-dependent hydrolase (beta-lactamase superfamily II)
MKIFPLSEGTFTVDKTKKFIPFDKESDKLHDRPVGSLLVEIQPFCVVTKRDIIVIDTGLGFTGENGVLQLHQNLMDNGIDPEDVTKVLQSHLHKDHCGGIISKDPQSRNSTLSFPNAVYYINKYELFQHFDTASSSYDEDEMEYLKSSEKIILYDTTGFIDDYIQFEMTGGHSKYHCVFWIKEEDEILFYGGDVAPQLQQMKNKFVAKYDFDGKKSMELRQQWWHQGQQEHWTFMFYHDIKHPVFTCK